MTLPLKKFYELLGEDHSRTSRREVKATMIFSDCGIIFAFDKLTNLLEYQYSRLPLFELLHLRITQHTPMHLSPFDVLLNGPMDYVDIFIFIFK